MSSEQLDKEDPPAKFDKDLLKKLGEKEHNKKCFDCGKGEDLMI
jgi:hypothetical protein